jgi:serine/threonine protein phosphatase PrpC
MSRVEVHYGVATDVGRVREVNEDACLAEPPVFVVADGMGGHHGGDVASSIVVEEFAHLAGRRLGPRDGASAVAATLEACQRRIHEYAEREHGSSPREWYAGTTAVVGLLVEDEDGAAHWLLANLGDSRAYVVHHGVLGQVTVDHSLVQELVDAGQITPEQAEVHPERHVVTRALGGPDLPEADFFRLPPGSAERLLLCSDGVSGMLGHEDLARLVSSADDPADAARDVVAAAVDAGGIDNATAVVVDLVPAVSS